jgi:hypothetical protein
MVTNYHYEKFTMAGDEVSYIGGITNRKEWITNIFFQIVASADAANRQPKFETVEHDGSQMFMCATTAAITASQTKGIQLTDKNIHGDVTDIGTAMGYDADVMIQLIDPILYNKQSLKISVANGHANDVITIRAKYLSAPLNEDFHP